MYSEILAAGRCTFVRPMGPARPVRTGCAVLCRPLAAVSREGFNICPTQRGTDDSINAARLVRRPRRRPRPALLRRDEVDGAPCRCQQPQPKYAVVAPKKRPVWPWILGGIFLVIFLGVGACVAFVGGVASNLDKETKREVEVIYAVSGSGRSVAITYSGRDFNTAQETAVSLPWKKSVTIDGLGKTVSLTATNDMNGGTITCRITANGKTIAEQTSSGPFATASCIGN